MVESVAIEIGNEQENDVIPRTERVGRWLKADLRRNRLVRLGAAMETWTGALR